MEFGSPERQPSSVYESLHQFLCKTLTCFLWVLISLLQIGIPTLQPRDGNSPCRRGWCTAYISLPQREHLRLCLKLELDHVNCAHCHPTQSSLLFSPVVITWPLLEGPIPVFHGKHSQWFLLVKSGTKEQICSIFFIIIMFFISLIRFHKYCFPIRWLSCKNKTLRINSVNTPLQFLYTFPCSRLIFNLQFELFTEWSVIWWSVFPLCLAQDTPRRHRWTLLPYRETPSGCLRLYSTMCNHDKNKARQRPATHMLTKTCKPLTSL